MSTASLRIGGHEPEAVYRYTDADRASVGAVARYAPGTVAKKKSFLQFRREGEVWKPGLDGLELPLYNLLSASVAIESEHTVLVLEGEKDVDAAEAALDFAATTCAGGAGNWRQRHTDALRGADVVVIGDNDEPGKRHAQDVARALHGVAARVRVLVSLPGVGEGEDLSDWLEAGNGTAELLNLLNGLEDWRPSSGWGVPVPIVASESGAPFPLEDGLPPRMGRLASAISETVKVSESAPAVILPAVVSAAAGNAFSIRVSPSHTERCLARYVAICADPGERKSSMFTLATDPMAHWASVRELEWRKANDQAVSANRILEQRIQRLERESANPGSKGLQETLHKIAALREEMVSLPRRPVIFSQDLTSPALVRLMAANGGAHAILSGDARTVVDQVLGMHRKDRKTDDAVFLAAHGADRFDRGRVGNDSSGEYLVLEKPSLALGLCLQADKVCELAGSRSLLDSGFLQRLNLSRPLSLVGYREETGDELPFPEGVRDEWRQVVERIIAWRFQVVDAEGPLVPLELRLSHDAMTRRKPFYNEIERLQRPGKRLARVHGFASKALGETARLAGLLHLYELARTGLDPWACPEVSEECWAWAEAHQRWQLEETLRVLGIAWEDDQDKRCARLLNYAGRNLEEGSKVSPSDVVTWKVAANTEEAESLLGYLASNGWVRLVALTGQQKARRWEFHPQVFPEEAA